MEFVKNVFLIILFIFSIDCLYSNENIIRFLNIIWETSPEQVILNEGTPDEISYNYGNDAKLSYDKNGVEHRTVVEIVWINSNINDNNLLEYAVKNNRHVGYDAVQLGRQVLTSDRLPALCII